MTSFAEISILIVVSALRYSNPTTVYIINEFDKKNAHYIC